MPLTANSYLGPYQILAPLGAGGMGEVYRARDTRLGRDVAIKVLPGDVADDPERRSRFEREARAVAALDHPHICGIYDVGEVNGTHYLVMPLIEGQTLAARLEQGPLPIADALRVAGEIADALDKAHRQGIVHRDLKPANVMLTKSGAGSGSPQVKLLDFGLAKLRPSAGAVALSHAKSATTTAGTAEGTILGTIHYMAPEQVEGREADHRADLWALGAVIYEMVTGARPFQGDTAASIMGAILKDAPAPLAARQALAPAALDRIVRRCLGKHADERWQSASDLKSALELIPHAAPNADAPAPSPSEARGRRPLLAASAALLTFAAGAWLGPRAFAPAAAPAEVVQFDIQPPVDVMLSPAPVAGTPQIALSPDGQQIAFVGMRRRGTSQIYVRSFDQRDARALAGTEGASFPFWSPDSEHLAFFANGKLKRIAVSGGAAQVVANAPAGRGGAWGADGTIVFCRFPNGGLERVSASGGESSPLTRVDRAAGAPGERVIGHNWPQFLPGGVQFQFYQRLESPQRQGIYVASLNSDAAPTLILPTNGLAQFSAGYLTWVRDGVLLAQRLNEQTFAPTGEPVQVADRVGYFSGTFGYSAFSASQAGLLAYGPPIGTVTSLRWYTRAGEVAGQLGPAGVYFSPRLSPDGRLVTVARAGETMTERDLWNLDVERASVLRVTSDPAADWFPAWAPGRLYFSSGRAAGLTSVFRKVGAGPEEFVFGQRYANYPDDVSADGRTLIYHQSTERGYDLGVVNLDGEPRPETFLATEFSEFQPRFAPNGRWIAYVSDESGQFDVYVRPYPQGNTQPVKVSLAGGMQPEWRRDGKELFYVSADGKMMAVSVSTASANFEAQEPRPLFDVETPESLAPYPTHYAVTADGSRFLVNTVVDQPVRPAITVIMNWTQLMRK